ncbi:MAG: glycosyltransferase family 4 protein [Anaerolineae bacterium]|nr:glycosyltransferase family 4 protein [Anaerolineae bacterium]
MTLHQLLPAFIPGDAIGNQAWALRQILRSLGFASSQVYALHRDRRWEDPGEDYRRLRLRSSDWLIYHHSIGSPVVEVALEHLPRLIFYYHNITPAHFVRPYDLRLARALDAGRQALSKFKSAPHVWAHSAYNLLELDQLGFRKGFIVPLFVDAPRLLASARSEAGQNIQAKLKARQNGTLWLFVGRIVPNKRQDLLIKALAYWQRVMGCRGSLLLVGSSVNAEGFRVELGSLAVALGVADSVHLVGACLPEEGLGGYYACADVFVCASEHEGFGVPLVEAMAFGKPIVAYAATGVLDAVGAGGLLVDEATPAALAEGVALLLNDSALREQYARHQRARVQAHEFAAVAQSVQNALGQAGILA